ncbi:MAG TPA: response regulator [Verrucomicrobiae bacterium]|jgi:HD-like signal output (HDOD) protein|nr:response regulator [Verrucomicrobiae bacterium]
MKTLLFVDDESRVLQGLQRQLRSMRNDWDMHFADSAGKALDFMASHPVDVIVSDMMMPAMDGAELLTEVSRRHPNTVRIVLSGHAEREAVLRLVGPAHQYLSKPCDAEELRVAVSRAFALRELLANEQLKQLATRIKCLPTLPALYQQLTAELRKEDSSMDRVGEIISRDIGMTAKIMQLVNSAFFGLPQPLSNPAEAAMYLGLSTIRSLVLSLQVFSQFKEPPLADFSLDALANHSWVTAVLARRIARVHGSDTKVMDQCFLAGLLHDVGRLVLASGLPEQYARIWNIAGQRGVLLWQAEKIEFGATHADLGAYLLGLWGLPNPIVEAVALQHCPSHSPSREFSPLTAVHVADVFAHEKNGVPAESISVDEDYIAQLGMTDRVAGWREVCFAEEP